jgi:hypothetical protein
MTGHTYHLCCLFSQWTTSLQSRDELEAVQNLSTVSQAFVHNDLCNQLVTIEDAIMLRFGAESFTSNTCDMLTFISNEDAENARTI